MLQDFSSIYITSVHLGTVLANLFTALFCGMVISAVYKWVHNGPVYSAKYVQAMVILSMITALVIMVIGNNLARAFGLVGAMSIIRFRTAVKDTQDIVFIFFSLAAGMASGVGLRLIALVGTLFIGTVLIVLSKSQVIRPKKREFLIQFHSRLSEKKPLYIPIFNKYCKKFRVVNMHSLGEEEGYELSFYIMLKDIDQSPFLMKELNTIAGINNIHFYFDEE
jgi:uncharacterized membrane protein YhiD involved in acid resistance